MLRLGGVEGGGRKSIYDTILFPDIVLQQKTSERVPAHRDEDGTAPTSI